jgi:D-mannonate dehydratase
MALVRLRRSRFARRRQAGRGAGNRRRAPSLATAAPEAKKAGKRAVAVAGLTWDVCDSIPVSAAVKLPDGPRRRTVDAWKDSRWRLARSGVATVCYDVRPVADWTRTDVGSAGRRGSPSRAA